MKNLIENISRKKPVVVWNPYKANDTLSKEEFISLIKISGYVTVVFEGDWITAYQPGIKVFGYETLDKDLSIARAERLHIYAAILQDELERQETVRTENIRHQELVHSRRKVDIKQ